MSGSYYTLFEQEILDLIEAKKTEFGLKHQDIISMETLEAERERYY